MKKLLLIASISLSFAFSSAHASAVYSPLMTGNMYPEQNEFSDPPMTMCTMDYNPVCGTDGVTYGNACSARKTPIAYKGECDSYIDAVAYAKLVNTKTNTLTKQLAKYNNETLTNVLGTIDKRIEMVKLSRISREMQVQRITLYTFVKNTIPEIIQSRATASLAKKPGIENISYTIEGENVLLKNGVSEKTMSGSASKIVTRYFGNSVMGDFNADGKDDIAFLLTQETGGSGVFYYLAAALMTDNGYTGTNAVFIGDRIAPESTNFVGSDIVVNYAQRKLAEAMTVKPSIGTSDYFRVINGKLEKAMK